MNNEIDRLRADLIATREKNGVYLSQSYFEQSEEERATLRKRTDEVGVCAVSNHDSSVSVRLTHKA